MPFTSHNLLRQYIRNLVLVETSLEEDLKNVGSKHQKTVKGASALKKMHDVPGVMAALSKITKPAELTQVLEALLDAVPVSSRADILKVLRNVTRHEKKTRMR